MTSMLERLGAAMNAHDAGGLADLFADDYRSAQPVHPGRGFGGKDQVFANWSSVFAGVPDFAARLVASSVDGAVEWGEWDWTGRHPDGTAFAMRGVTVVVVTGGLIGEARLYMEPVDAADEDIDAAVQRLYRPPS